MGYAAKDKLRAAIKQGGPGWEGGPQSQHTCNPVGDRERLTLERSGKEKGYVLHKTKDHKCFG